MREARYEKALTDYEKNAVRANVWQAALPAALSGDLQPERAVYSLVRREKRAGHGWRAWDIAAFTTFLSCFAKMATKSSKAAKLFNAVQRAEVRGSASSR